MQFAATLRHLGLDVHLPVPAATPGRL